MFSPLDYTCSHDMGDGTFCMSEPSVPCRGMPLGEYHSERLNAVAAQDRSSTVVPDELIVDAINKSGVI